MFHPVPYLLFKVYPGLRNHQKLTPETSKSIPDRQNTNYVIKWEFTVGSRLDGFWILDVVLIHLRTFKPLDRRHVCISLCVSYCRNSYRCTWKSDVPFGVCCQFKSISPTLNTLTPSTSYEILCLRVSLTWRLCVNLYGGQSLSPRVCEIRTGLERAR